jgi:hypothetical protein
MRGSSPVAAALVVVSLCSSCGDTTSASRSTTAAESVVAVPTRVQGNQIVLSEKQSRALLGWARRFRECLADRGMGTSVRVTRRSVALSVAGGGEPEKLAKLAVACGESLGGPPPRASLQAFEGTFVLYLPKQCLLDAKIAREGA